MTYFTDHNTGISFHLKQTKAFFTNNYTEALSQPSIAASKKLQNEKKKKE